MAWHLALWLQYSAATQSSTEYTRQPAVLCPPDPGYNTPTNHACCKIIYRKQEAGTDKTQKVGRVTAFSCSAQNQLHALITTQSICPCRLHLCSLPTFTEITSSGTPYFPESPPLPRHATPDCSSPPIHSLTMGLISRSKSKGPLPSFSRRLSLRQLAAPHQ